MPWCHLQSGDCNYSQYLLYHIYKYIYHIIGIDPLSLCVYFSFHDELTVDFVDFIVNKRKIAKPRN